MAGGLRGEQRRAERECKRRRVRPVTLFAPLAGQLLRDGEPFKAFEPSLFVWATVMSRPTADRAIVDAGLKALAFDSGPPLVCDEPATTYERASDEHGRLAVAAATNRLALGDKIRLIPGHRDPTVKPL